MKSEKLFIEILNRNLSPVSIDKLNLLYQMKKSEKEFSEFSVLADALRNDKIIQFVLRFLYAYPVKKTPDPYPGYLNSGEIMKILDISERTLAKWRKSGILTYTVFKSKCFYNVKDVENLLLKNYTRATDKKEI